MVYENIVDFREHQTESDQTRQKARLDKKIAEFVETSNELDRAWKAAGHSGNFPNMEYLVGGAIVLLELCSYYSLANDKESQPK